MEMEAEAFDHEKPGGRESDRSCGPPTWMGKSRPEVTSECLVHPKAAGGCCVTNERLQVVLSNQAIPSHEGDSGAPGLGMSQLFLNNFENNRQWKE